MSAEATARQAYRARRGEAEPGRAMRLAELLFEMAPTLDTLAGHEGGHALRTCFLAMRLAEAMSIGDRDRLALFYAALLHDAGSLVETDPTTGRPAMMRRLMPLPRGTEDERRAAEHVRVRRGAQFATRAGFGPEVAVTVMALHERWDGRGLPMGLTGEAIPIFARIVAIADGLELAVAREGRQAAITTAHARSGTWYDPEITSVMLALCGNGLLRELEADDLDAATLDLEPSWLVRLADPADADRIRNALSLAGAS
jgi:HD-GYP domain-containing protein (c-di-GMP phosphodiesterase class II)